jgi:hypothetical protein
MINLYSKCAGPDEQPSMCADKTYYFVLELQSLNGSTIIGGSVRLLMKHVLLHVLKKKKKNCEAVCVFRVPVCNTNTQCTLIIITCTRHKCIHLLYSVKKNMIFIA